MANFFSAVDIDPDLIKALKVAVIGYGSQGHAHALNLRDSGVDVVVILPPESRSRARARQDGMRVQIAQEAVPTVDVLMLAVPDVKMRAIYEGDLEPHLKPGQTLLFAHGLNIHFNLIEPAPDLNVALVAPKGPGPKLRQQYLVGGGMPSLVAVHQDPNGQTLPLALSYAWGIGCAKGMVMETTFREETETDLFGEQAVLCGGISALIKAGFDTLVEAGYQPEAAYFECLHECKLIVDLIFEGGLTHMWKSISDTAEWGGYTAGSRIIGDASRQAMREILAEIQSGQFVQEWAQEDQAGRPRMQAFQEADRSLIVEEVGRQLRPMMPFVQAK